MEVDQHQLLVRALDRQIAHQQAALEVGDAQRPGEGAGQRQALRAFDVVAGGGQQAAVDLAHRHLRGQRHRHEGAGIVEREYGVAAAELLGLVDAVGTGGIGIDLLQQDQVRLPFAVVDRAVDPGQVFADLHFVRRAGAFAAVHEEIGSGAEAGIADVPAEQVDALPGRQRVRVDRGGEEFHRFPVCGLIFGIAQPADQAAEADHNNQNKNKQQLQQAQ